MHPWPKSGFIIVYIHKFQRSNLWGKSFLQAGAISISGSHRPAFRLYLIRPQFSANTSSLAFRWTHQDAFYFYLDSESIYYVPPLFSARRSGVMAWWCVPLNSLDPCLSGLLDRLGCRHPPRPLICEIRSIGFTWKIQSSSCSSYTIR